MSIYATLWRLRFPKQGDDYHGCEWVTVIAQGVPAHVGTPTPMDGGAEGDPYADFLPPPVPADERGDADYLRAVVFVTEGTKKGTPRHDQKYVDPLLVMMGREYAEATFAALHERICDALRGDRPRVTAQVLTPDGRVLVLREDGTTEDLGPLAPRGPGSA